MYVFQGISILAKISIEEVDSDYNLKKQVLKDRISLKV